MEEHINKKAKHRRPRGQLVPLGSKPGYPTGKQDYGIRVPLRERGTDGRNKSHYATLRCVTEPQAYKHKDMLIAQIDAGEFFVPREMTIKEFAEEWLGEKKRQRLKPNTIYAYG